MTGVQTCALPISALVPLATFTAAVLTVAVLAGVSLIPNIDLSLVIANARDSLAAARANRINANGQLVTIQANAAPRLAIQSSALAALYGEANNPTTGIVATANGLGAPAGTAPLNALDTIIADAVISQRALSDAAFNVSAAGDELRRAQEAVPIDAAVVANRQALLASAIIALPTAIIAFGTQRQALIDASRREYCAPGCGLFYDGRAGMTAAFDAYVNAANDAFIDTKKLQLAQQNYDAALLAEQEAQAALDQLLAANTSPTAGAATPITVWSGAEGILRRADALGGTR